MKFLLSILSLFFFSTLPWFGAFSMVNMSVKKEAFVPGELVVKFKGGLRYNDENFLMNLGCRIVDYTKDGEVFLVNIGHKHLLSMIEKLSFTRRFAYIYPNYLYHIYEDTFTDLPNDPMWDKLWAFENTGQVIKIKDKETGIEKEFVGTPGSDIKVRDAWQYTKGSKDVVVAVIDTGVYYKHEDLVGNIWKNADEVEGNGVDDDKNGFVDDVRGWNFASSSPLPLPIGGGDDDPGNNDPTDAHIHGTHVSGTIGAMGNNSLGVSGVNWNVSIMPLRFLGEQGQGSLMGAVKAIKYATENGAKIINASWGAGQSAKPLEDAINEATAKGMLFVAAAGNDGKDNDSASNFPSNYKADGVLAVAASMNNDELTWFSNFGKHAVDVAAPGLAILSTTPKHAEFGNADYVSASGTSMATPVTAGVAALLLSYKPELTNMQLKSLIMASSARGDKISGKTITGGRVDVGKAMRMLANNELYVVPNSTEILAGASYKFSAFGGSGGYKFSLASSDVGSIDENGNFTATKEGEVVVKVTDSSGKVAQTSTVFVVKAGGGGGGEGECPEGTIPIELPPVFGIPIIICLPLDGLE